MAEEPRDILSKAAAIRETAITPAQAQRRREVDERNRRIAAGIKAPASGTFGKPKKD